MIIMIIIIMIICWQQPPDRAGAQYGAGRTTLSGLRGYRLGRGVIGLRGYRATTASPAPTRLRYLIT